MILNGTLSVSAEDERPTTMGPLYFPPPQPQQRELEGGPGPTAPPPMTVAAF